MSSSAAISAAPAEFGRLSRALLSTKISVRRGGG